MMSSLWYKNIARSKSLWERPRVAVGGGGTAETVVWVPDTVVEVQLSVVRKVGLSIRDLRSQDWSVTAVAVSLEMLSPVI